MRRTMIALGAAALWAAPGLAETAYEAALSGAAEPLDSEEIAETFSGRTGLWVSADGEKRVLIHYGAGNALTGRADGGGWSGEGFWAVTDDDRMCISWQADPVRLRCLDVVRRDGAIRKFNADGSLNGSYERFDSGKAF